LDNVLAEDNQVYDNVLCVGFPQLHYSNGKSCIEIDQSQDEVIATIYFWKEVINIKVYVKLDPPPDNVPEGLPVRYKLREGTPTEIGVYRFYRMVPDVPGTGTFERVDTIPLEKMDELTFYGEKIVDKIRTFLRIGLGSWGEENVLCIGYPSINYIDGKGCVRIDQWKNEVIITVYYWEALGWPIE
jgi:hypothetical protein